MPWEKRNPDLTNNPLYLEPRVNELAADLAETVNNTTKEFSPVKGINLFLGDASWVPTEAQFDAVISKTVQAGITDVYIVVYCTQSDGNTGVTPVQSTSDTVITTNIQKAVNAGLNIKGIKVHVTNVSNSNSLNPSNMDTWFANYKAILVHLAQLCQPYNPEYFFVSNERTDLTRLASNVTRWQDIINTVKTYGYKTMCSCTYEEAYLSRILSLVDAIGINMYPHMSAKGINATLQECIQAWSHDLAGREWIRTIEHVKETYNKPVFITETGTLPHPDALLNPEKWDYGAYTADHRIQEKFYRATLYVLGVNEMVDGVFFWESTSSGWNPYNEPTMSTLKEFFGGAN